MRKRPILLAAAVAVAGLAALGTVVAQQPGGYSPGTAPKGAPGTAPQAATPVTRPYNEWTPTPPPAGYTPTQPGAVRPVGGSYVPPPPGSNTQVNYPPLGGTPANRPRLNNPGVATGDIKPVGGFDIPPPSMDFSNVGAKPPATTGAPLPPPSISVDTSDNKFPPAPPVSTPPPPSGVVPPALPSTPVTPPPAPPVGTPKPFPVPPPALPVPPLPATGPTTSTPMVGNVMLPNKTSQSVTVQAICPESVVFNAEFRYELIIRNEGNVAVQSVRVEDEIPTGARYVGSDPPAELNGDKLVWAIGTMDSHTDKRITIRLRPSEEGELRSRAWVSYSASVEAKTRVTRPRIAVTATCGEVCRVGEDATFQIKVTNSGTGPAQNMVLRAEMTDGLFYPLAPKLGPKLETTLATLAAGETKVLNLPLNAVKAGLNACQFTVTAEGSQETSAKAQVNVVEPLLQITQTGPAKCLVRGEPTYEITLANPGTATTDPITLHAVLPDGFDFAQASDTGVFSPTNRAISWKLQGLPAGGTKTVALKLRATAAGDVTLRTVAVAAPEQQIAPAGVGAKPVGRVLEAKGECPIRSEGVAAVRFEVKDLEDPVEVGKEAIYEIRVTNQGTGACTNVQLLAALADGTTFVSATGPTNVKAQGQTLVFDPLPTLPVGKTETVYTVRVKGNVVGDQRFRVQLTCDQVRTPVQKEESTSFYKQ